MDFGGETFVFALRGDEGDDNDFTIEAEDGDVFNDAVYERMSHIEDTYNINLDILWCGGTNTSLQGSDMYKFITQSMMAGDSEFDAILTVPYCTCDLAQGGYLLDMTELNYLNLDQPWWDEKAIEQLSLNGKIYFTNGEITIMDNMAASVLFFNKKMIDDYDLDDPYQDVRDGKWTLDKMISDAKAVSGDINGDGVQDDYDNYSYTFWQDDSMALIHGTGSTFSTINEKGEFEYTADSDHFTDSYAKLMELPLSPCRSTRPRTVSTTGATSSARAVRCMNGA